MVLLLLFFFSRYEYTVSTDGRSMTVDVTTNLPSHSQWPTRGSTTTVTGRTNLKREVIVDNLESYSSYLDL